MSGAFWTDLANRVFGLLERLVQIWIAFRAGRAAQSADHARHASEVKDDQAKAAAERPVDRNDLVRKLRDTGL